MVPDDTPQKMLVIRPDLILKIKGSDFKQISRIEAGLMAGKIPVHGKMRHFRLSCNTLTGLLLQHISVENPASRFSFSGLLRGKLLLFPNRCRGLLQHIRRKEHISAI